MAVDLTTARAIWVSDLHLGSRECRADKLLQLIKEIPEDWTGRLFLVGDVVDLWAMKKFWYWPREHNLVMQKILRIKRNGAEVTFLPGNHDEEARPYCGHVFAGVSVESEVLYLAADGKKYLVTHGDQYDSLLRNTLFDGDLLAWLAGLLSILNNRVNRLGWWPHISLRDHVVRWFGGAGENHAVFRKAATLDATSRGCDGIICGHIHFPEVVVGTVAYLNCGDWTENCTALVEDQSGQISLHHV